MKIVRILVIISIILLIYFNPYIVHADIVHAANSKIDQHHTDNSFDPLLTQFGYHKISMIKIRETLYAKGKVGKQAVYFLLDTGSIEPSILTSSVKPLHLHSFQSQEKLANMTGQIRFAQKTILSEVSIGNIKLGHLTAKLMDQPFKNDLPTIVLGNQFFTKYHAIFDIEQKTLYLNPKKISRKNQHHLNQILIEHEYQAIPLTKLNEGHFILPIQINNAKPSYFLFDTGTSATTLSHSYIQALQLTPNGEYKTQAATNGNISISTTFVNNIIFNPLQLFNSKSIELHNRNITIANIEYLQSILGVPGVMGLEEMEKIHAIINISTDSVYFKNA